MFHLTDMSIADMQRQGKLAHEGTRDGDCHCLITPGNTTAIRGRVAPDSSTNVECVLRIQTMKALEEASTCPSN